MENATLLLSLAGGLSTLVSLTLEVALLVVALGPVHKRRPDASTFLAVSAGLNLIATITWFPATVLLTQVLGVAGYAGVTAVLSLGTAVLHGLSGVLLILGVIRLAAPPQGDPTRYG